MLSVLTEGPLYPREMAEIQNPVEPLVKADGVNFTREQIERLLAAACNFQGQGMAAREKCREDFRDAEREEDNTLRIMVDGLVASLQDSGDGVDLACSNVH